MRWTRRSRVLDAPPALPEPRATPRFTGPAEYLTLHKYLRDRFADTVVLTFAQIEDLLGFALPDVAGLRPEWWATGVEAPSAQSRSWTQASRTAQPNLPARTVAFHRLVV